MGRLLIDGSPGNEIVDVVKPVDARLQGKWSSVQKSVEGETT